MSYKFWLGVSTFLKWTFDREYSVFEVIMLMGLVQATNNFFIILAVGLLIVMVGGFMRGFSDALADHLKN